ncbi:hypothetical protein CPB85DRAFT_1255460 [Mucidula mucida]|nr:hypothetical protein CPB85DRAFT_1255460 [Mucidula mucida]
MLIVHDVALNNGAGQMTTMDADTPSDAQETSSSDADCDGFFESEGVVDGADGLGTYNQNAVAASSQVPLPADDNPSVEGSTSHKKEVSLPSFNAKDACRYYQNLRQNAARAAARVVFVTPFRQDEVARAQSALRGPPQELSRRPKATKRQATDSDTTRRAKGKKKADQQSKPDPFSYASPTFQSSQPPAANSRLGKRCAGGQGFGGPLSEKEEFSEDILNEALEPASEHAFYEGGRTLASSLHFGNVASYLDSSQVHETLRTVYAGNYAAMQSAALPNGTRTD